MIVNPKNSFLSADDKQEMLDMVNSKLSLRRLGWKIFSIRTTDLSEIMIEV